jgi:hypothetical protein
MDEIPSNHAVYVIRKVDVVEANKTSADIVRLLLRQTVNGLKAELDPVAWINAGWVELEAFTDALCGGGMHPALAEWESARAKGGRPAPAVLWVAGSFSRLPHLKA